MRKKTFLQYFFKSIAFIVKINPVMQLYKIFNAQVVESQVLGPNPPFSLYCYEPFFV